MSSLVKDKEFFQSFLNKSPLNEDESNYQDQCILIKTNELENKSNSYEEQSSDLIKSDTEILVTLKSELKVPIIQIETSRNDSYEFNNAKNNSEISAVISDLINEVEQMILDPNDLSKTCDLFSKSDECSTSDNDSPIKLKKKKVKSLIDDTDDTTENKMEMLSESNIISKNCENLLNLDEQPLSDNDSPIKLKKKRISSLIDDTEDTFETIMETKTVIEKNFNFESPIKIPHKKYFEEDSQHEIDKNYKSIDLFDSEEDKAIERTEKSINSMFHSEKKSNILDDIFDTEEMEDEVADLKENEVDSSLKFEATMPSREGKKSYHREAKGKDLMKQPLSLPYFQMPKPDFKKYLNETDKRLEKQLLGMSDNFAKIPEPIRKKTLKPVDKIIFEIGFSKSDKVEPFRKKVLGMMKLTEKSNAKVSEQGGCGNTNKVSTAIGAGRLNWKMKLLKDIAKKKEAALKERNEMLKEALEEDEEIIDKEYDNESEVEDDDEVDVHFPCDNSSAMDNDVSLETFNDLEDESPAVFSNTTGNDSDTEKELDLPPLCFSLPSFQSNGFPKCDDQSISNVSETETTDNFNEDYAEVEIPDMSENNTSELKNLFPLAPVSKNDKKVYDKVLVEEQLLSKENITPGEIMTADIVDMCSGQFLEEEEMLKTPPIPDELTNMSTIEESDASDEDCPVQPETESDSDSEEELNYKRKVLKKKIRPISPIDEESRHGEEDIQINPSSVLMERSTSYDFTKNKQSSRNESVDENHEDDKNTNDCSMLRYDSEESLIEENKNDTEKPSKNAFDFFDVEAELSGEEASSDEDEADLDGEEALAIDDTEHHEDEELRNQIGTLHLKHLLDDDDKIIRQVKNHFLDEGELYSDAARQRKFNWSFNPVEDSGNNPNLSGSEEEEDLTDSPFQQDKLKWKQETSNLEETGEDLEKRVLETNFKVEIQQKITSQIVARRLNQTINKRPRNSFLDEGDAKLSFKKIKLDILSGQGTRTTKNFVFTESHGPKKQKESIHKNSFDSSVFDII